jgi:hypothetical protein
VVKRVPVRRRTACPPLVAEGLDPATLRVAGVILGLVYGLATIFLLGDLMPRRDMTRGVKTVWFIVILSGCFIGHIAYYVRVYRKGR